MNLKWSAVVIKKVEKLYITFTLCLDVNTGYCSCKKTVIMLHWGCDNGHTVNPSYRDKVCNPRSILACLSSNIPVKVSSKPSGLFLLEPFSHLSTTSYVIGAKSVNIVENGTSCVLNVSNRCLHIELTFSTDQYTLRHNISFNFS
jgi:hypothetical protein